MGSGPSQEDYHRMSQEFYEAAVRHPCILPDAGIDESILKYSGLSSNTELQTYSDDLVNSVPDFIGSLGSALGGLTSVPNAVGLGALVISIIMEICIKSSTHSDSYGLLRRIFGEEKASAVRDTMSESVKRYRIFINKEQHLQEEIERLEVQLSGHLTTLRNSLLYDGQMSTRGFKIWVNGASFHIQMLIHQARLKVKAGEPASDYNDSIKVAITLYMQSLDHLLEQYKTYQTSITSIDYFTCYSPDCAKVFLPKCILKNREVRCQMEMHRQQGCSDSPVVQGYVQNVFSKYEPISSLRNHFSNIMNNIDSLINQDDGFTLPSTT